MKNNDKIAKEKFDNSRFLISTIKPYILETVKKHGVEFTEAGLMQYLILGNPNGLSRIPDNNGTLTRESLKYIDIDEARRVVVKIYSGKNIKETVELFVQGMIKEHENANNIDINVIVDILAKVTTDTYLKYGQMNASLAVANFLSSGYKNYFTRLSLNGEVSRDLLNTVDYNLVRDFLIEYTGDNQIQVVVDKFIDDYVVGGMDNHYKK